MRVKTWQVLETCQVWRGWVVGEFDLEKFTLEKTNALLCRLG